VVRDQLLKGESFGNALANTKVIPGMVTRTLVAAESSDRLAESIDELCELLQLRQKFSRDQRRLLLYPLTVLGVFVLLAVGMLLYVIPMFSRLYAVAGDQLFWPTQVMVALSELLRGSPEGWFAAVLLLGLGGLGLRHYGKWGNLWAQVPGVRELRREIQMMMYARTMSSGLHSGMPLTLCLQLMEPMLMDFRSSELARLRERVEHGEGLGKSYQQVAGLGPRFSNAVSAGEATGDLAGAFTHVSENCRIEVERTLGRFNAYLEPALMLLIASGVLVFLLSIYLPLFQVAEYY
jgi:type II secretory pathway component PulF